METAQQPAISSYGPFQASSVPLLVEKYALQTKARLKNVKHALSSIIKKLSPEFPPGMMSLRSNTTSEGNILLAYILKSYKHRQDTPAHSNHTYYGESMLIAEILRKHDNDVNVFDYWNNKIISPVLTR